MVPRTSRREKKGRESFRDENARKKTLLGRRGKHVLSDPGPDSQLTIRGDHSK